MYSALRAFVCSLMSLSHPALASDSPPRLVTPNDNRVLSVIMCWSEAQIFVLTHSWKYYGIEVMGEALKTYLERDDGCRVLKITVHDGKPIPPVYVNRGAVVGPDGHTRIVSQYITAVKLDTGSDAYVLSDQPLR